MCEINGSCYFFNGGETEEHNYLKSDLLCDYNYYIA